ncbi:D-erythrulose-4-phosphate isomerase [Lichenifustis flavocetrariae]|uniref:RpiB/LacA/LacB family sugar-phosphate isomerase n=1 Tax=Lichenifustis flavocetrariae TaxID=2949735 RepID=A0AA42CH08_9HYPH|nr:RpiB/LacA/LacB family sugar-phosphate isomerase [Lichenifustis flavocetrariae]MCW6507098.1 RpiB/LacA/LacB family sugar-phosphate isomerase [Lichenifustis flavocetrariae]
MKVVIAGDSAGAPLCHVIGKHLEGKAGIEVTDLSAPKESEPEFYAHTSERAAKAVVDGTYDRGILFCGTGIGVCIAANKIPGIRAAQAHDTYSAERAAKSNNAQIITLGARVVGPELAKAIVDMFLASEFDPKGSSASNVKALDGLDAKYSNVAGR